jgi:predicted phage baseplate assembly protein
VARGNIVLADHGRTIGGEQLNAAPKVGQYRPRLEFKPLTQQGHVPVRRGRAVEFEPFDEQAPASAAFAWEMRDVRPAIVLDPGGQDWRPQRDLLKSDRFAREFVAEVENDGNTYLRFGDDVLGRKPTPGTVLTAEYRVGNGPAGNVGVGAIARMVFADARIIRVWNPLAASGGVAPESLEQVRQFAPQAFRVQERAVTEADYAEVAQRHPEVQKAAATMRWTGSWYTAFVTIDRRGGRPVDAEFELEIRDHLERYRLAGYDVEVNAPVFVPLDMAITVCVTAGYFRSNVKQALLRVFGARDYPGGRGFFHPDNFTFGQPLYLSQVYQAAMAVPGVDSIEVTRFQRLGKVALGELDAAQIKPGTLEILRLDNDPNFPENGKLEFTMKGGL